MVPLGPDRVRVSHPWSLVTGLVITALMRSPTLPRKVRFALWPGLVIFIGTAGPLTETVQQLPAAVVAARAIAGPPFIRSITLATVTVLRPVANALPNTRSLMAPPFVDTFRFQPAVVATVIEQSRLPG